MDSVLRAIYLFGKLIKFSHTIFAMPFALSSVVLAHVYNTPVKWKTFFWILVAMVSARSAAMGFNRWADLRFDRLNPRTLSRPSVTGAISPRTIFLLIIFFSALFILSAYQLGALCFWLSFPTLGVLLSYSYTKRFTSWSHLYLGFAIGLAPLGAWIAVTGSWDWRIVPLTVALLTYISGFDILYACQDIDFDRMVGLYSLPSRFGVRKALVISSILHLITFISLLSLIPIFNLGKVYGIFLVIIGFLLLWEHSMVRPEDLSRVPIAFFHVNSMVSVALFAGIGLDVLFK
ncbi:MAG: putative 4-hydroxybenzoate polyprenyltransferase [Syntrophobacterales bacterium]|nr:putative 4-hydroxybenzoate polyprenyltransferase [Syntrophobacterales bacterium]